MCRTRSSHAPSKRCRDRAGSPGTEPARGRGHAPRQRQRCEAGVKALAGCSSQALRGRWTRVCFERPRIVTRSYQETEGQYPALRRAKALRAVFEQMPIMIRPGEMLVGQRASVLAGRSVYPEYNLGGLTAETTPPEIWNYWHGRTLGDHACRAHRRTRTCDRLCDGYGEQVRACDRRL